MAMSLNAKSPSHQSIDILLIVEADIATTELLERLLLACFKYGILFRKRYLRDLSLRDFGVRTIPLFVRTGDPAGGYWARLLRDSKWPYVYYIDDNFWEIRGESPLAIYYQNGDVRRTLQAFIANADRVLTNSNVLAQYLGRFSGEVRCIPAFFDFSLIPRATHIATDERRIGFAGSSSRDEDLQLIVPAINVVLARFPDVVFEFAGVMPAGVLASERVRFFPQFPNYAEFVKFQASRGWLLGLAPLLDKVSNRSKTNNKFREYGACGVAGIYSKIEPYAEVIPEVSGLLVSESASAWTDAICRLLDDPELTKKIAAHAYAVVVAKYSVDTVAGQWVEELVPLGPQSVACSRSFSRRALWRLDYERQIGRVRSLRLLVALSYREGGSNLVVRKILARARNAWRGTR